MTNSQMHRHGSHLRSIVHYAAAVTTMGLYGGQVCPLVETLDLQTWMSVLARIFFLVFLIRILLIRRVVDTRPWAEQVSALFWAELAALAGAGILVAGINRWAYGFPGIESGLKMILGTTVLGFFIAADLALERERRLADALETLSRHLPLPRHIFPMTLKFGIVAVAAALSVSAVVLLVVLKDLGWMMDVETIDAAAARISVIKEIVFVTLVFLLYVFNLILSYAKNLNMALTRENSALIRVANGDLDARVTVSTRDEFGVMARYTNDRKRTGHMPYDPAIL